MAAHVPIHVLTHLQLFACTSLPLLLGALGASGPQNKHRRICSQLTDSEISLTSICAAGGPILKALAGGGAASCLALMAVQVYLTLGELMCLPLPCGGCCGPFPLSHTTLEAF